MTTETSIDMSAEQDYIESLKTHKLTMESVSAQMQIGFIGLGEQAGNITDSIFAGQHILLEGEPGVGKSELVKNIGQVITAGEATPFRVVSRLQGASDKQPADFIGAEVFNQQLQVFETRKGPIFGHFVFADELNRNNTKTQAALNEAMAEGQVTIGTESLLLPDPFMVIATQNENEFGQGTQPVSDALLDRFGASSYFGSPSQKQREQVGLAYSNGQYLEEPRQVMKIADLKRMQQVVRSVPVDQKAIEWLAGSIEHIASAKGIEMASRGHRGMQATIRMAQAHALRTGNAAVTREHFAKVLPITYSHRIKSVGNETNHASKLQVIEDAVKAKRAA